MQRLFIASLLFLGGNCLIAQEVAVQVRFSPQACNGQDSLVGPSSWNCGAVISDAGTVTTERSGELSGTTVSAIVKKSLKTGARTGGIVSADQMSISVYGRKRLAYYTVQIDFEADVEASQQTDSPTNFGALSSWAYINGSFLGIGQWGERASYNDKKRYSQSGSRTLRSASQPTTINGQQYYSLGSINLFVRQDCNKPNSTTIGTSSVRLTAAETRWTTNNGPGSENYDFRQQCSRSNKSAFARTNYFNGDAKVEYRDPVATRGYPLANTVYIRNHTRFPGLRTPLGFNGAFTYGIAIRTASNGYRYLIGEDGSEYSYGPADGAPAAEPGVYAVLEPTELGWTLRDAGPPSRIYIAGNFRYDFDSQGRLLRIIDPSGNPQIVTYGERGLPVKVTDVNSNKVIAFEYDGDLITRLVENGGAAISHLGYQRERLTQITLTDSKGLRVNETAIAYDGQGRLASVTADRNNTSRVTWTYTDIGSEVTRANMSWGTGAGRGGTDIDYLVDDGPGANLTRVGRKNDRGGTTFYDFDASGNLAQIEFPRPDGAKGSPIVQIRYDASRNPIAITDGLTSLTMAYNSLGKPIRIVDATGSERTMTYNGVDLTGVSDSIGTLALLSYDDPANPHSPTSFTDGAGNTWLSQYNRFGQLLSIAAPAGSSRGVTTYTYDEDPESPNLGYLKQITNGAGDITTFDSYSPLGDVLEITTSPLDGVLNTTRFEYDAAQRLVKTVYPDGANANNEYEGRDLAKSIDENGGVTLFDFCTACGALEKVVRPLSKTLRVTHNGDHDILEYVDARSKTTTYTYGAARELRRTRYPDGTILNYTYDDTGRLASVENARKQASAVSYDPAGRIAQIRFSNGQPGLEYSYYPDGLPRVVKDEAGTSSYSYFPHRLLDTVTYDFAASGLLAKQSIKYSYNPDNTVSTMTWFSDGATVAKWEYQYDSAGRMASVANSFSERADFEYDRESKLVSQKNSNGTAAAYAYHQARGWPRSITWNSGSRTFASYALSYDKVGNLTKVTEAAAEIAYEYDGLYRITSESRPGVVSNRFGYDLANNITSKNGATFATYDDGNKVQAMPGANISHDADGNVITASAVSPGQLVWDVRSKLKTFNGAGYKYNAAGLRVVRTLGGQSTFYIYAGSQLIGEVTSGVPRVAYTWGPVGLVAQRLLTGQTSFYHFGPQGETRQLSDSAGTITKSYLYEAYGQELQPAAADTNPFRYGGRFGYYTEGGLMLAGARWYSPRLMRWLTRDPIGYGGGDNLYAYVDGRPTTDVDPLGLDGSSINQPPLQRLHPDSTISLSNLSSYNYWSKQPTESIVASLRPGASEELLVKPDGTVLQGNTRIRVLQERGFNVNALPRSIYSSAVDSELSMIPRVPGARIRCAFGALTIIQMAVDAYVAWRDREALERCQQDWACQCVSTPGCI